LNQFDGPRGNNDGIVTHDEFLDYYRDISMVCPSEDYFVQMMESTWQVPEKEDSSDVTQVVNMLLQEVRARVLELARNSPQLLQKVFNDFDLNGSGHLTIDEMTSMIAKLKIAVDRRNVYPFFKLIDRNNSGGIEFNEFEAYILGGN